MNLNKLRDAVHENAVKKGFWDNAKKDANGMVDVSKFVVLAAGELFEAVEADREGKFAADHVSPFGGSLVWDLDTEKECKGLPADLFGVHLKDTFEDEIADAFIRLLDLAGGLNIDLDIIRTDVLLEYAHSAEITSVHGKIQILARSVLLLVSPIGFCSNDSHETESRFHFHLNTMIRFCDEFELNLFRHIELKMWFNKSRAKLHGKRY